jgi:hypothetical protein
MKTYGLNLGVGLIVLVLVWLITLNNALLFLTLLWLPMLMVAFYFFTTHYHWTLTTLNFFICIIIALYLTDLVEKRFPNLVPSNQEDFPSVNFSIFFTISWIIIQTCIDILLRIILPKRFIQLSEIEEFINRNRQKEVRES